LQIAEQEAAPNLSKLLDGDAAALLDQMGSDWHWAWIKKRVISNLEAFRAAHHKLLAAHPQFKMWRRQQVPTLDNHLHSFVLFVTRFSLCLESSPSPTLLVWEVLEGELH
jgi:hypothetical protein